MTTQYKKNGKLAIGLILLGFGLCLLLALDPKNADWGGSAVREIKFAPLAAMLCSAVLLLLTVRVRWSLPFILLFSFTLMMLAGSLYSLTTFGIDFEETYLSRGLIASVSLLAGFLVAQRTASVNFLMPKIMLMLIGYAWGVATFSVLYRLDLAFGDLVQIYQMQSSLVAAAMLLMINHVKGTILNKLSLLVFAISLLLIAKTTALLMLTIVLVVYGYTFFFRFVTKGVQGQLIRWSAIVAGLASVLIVFGMLYQARLADRGNDVREYTMDIRIRQFVGSPIVGDMFTGSPLVDFGPLHIPSHSEWLDMLASAGVLTVLLLLLPMAWLVWKSSPLEVSARGLRLRQWLALVVITHAVLMTVNPILFMPSLAIPFWLMLGLLAGLHADNADYLGEVKGLALVRSQSGGINK